MMTRSVFIFTYAFNVDKDVLSKPTGDYTSKNNKLFWSRCRLRGEMLQKKGSSAIWSDGVLKRGKPLNNCIFELAPTNMQL